MVWSSRTVVRIRRSFARDEHVEDYLREKRGETDAAAGVQFSQIDSHKEPFHSGRSKRVGVKNFQASVQSVACQGCID